MGILKFKADEVKKLIDHACTAPEHSQFYGEKVGPALMLVGDQGVYLMSNGIPRFQAEGKPEGHSFVAYAEGCDPTLDEEEWWENKRYLFGGDDGADALGGAWMNKMAAMADAGATEILIRITPSTLELVD
ncbi:MAG: DUF3085 domain-containing protein [Rhodobacterales bacterium]|nr:DUF3085 domain-containing protein [Rhodobacterales bacterium]